MKKSHGCVKIFLTNENTTINNHEPKLLKIEHIQYVTDEKNNDYVRAEWGDELDRLGNLALLESSINRSISNHHDQKAEAYKQSRFIAIRELADKVLTWSKRDAEVRRKENSKILKEFLLKM